MPTTQRKVLLVHGWRDTPDNPLFTRLCKELSGLGVECVAPRFAYDDPHVSLQMLESLVTRERPLLGLIGFSLGARLAFHTRFEHERVIGLSTAFLSLPRVVKILSLSALQTLFGKPSCCHPSLTRLLQPPRILPDDLLVHAWDDTLIPVRTALRHARRAGARLILVRGGHALRGEEAFLTRLLLGEVASW